MIRGYILMQTAAGTGPRVTKEVARLEGVAHADEVAGPYDVIAQAEAPDLDRLNHLVVTKIQAIEGVTRTLLCTVVHL